MSRLRGDQFLKSLLGTCPVFEVPGLNEDCQHEPCSLLSMSPSAGNPKSWITICNPTHSSLCSPLCLQSWSEADAGYIYFQDALAKCRSTDHLGFMQ